MAEVTSINQPETASESDNDSLETLERNEVIGNFWDIYSDGGVELAGRYFEDQVKSNLTITKLLVPYMIEEGYKRGIDMPVFLAEVQLKDIQLKEEDENAIGTINDGCGLPDVVDDEVDDTQDEDEPTQERDDDLGDDKEE